MQYLEGLKELKEKRQITNAEIAKLANIPVATITRIFSGATPNPTFETVSQIAIALGASLDEIAGLKTSNASSVAAPIVATLDSYAALLKEKDERIKELKDDKNQNRRLIRKLMIFIAVFVGVAMLILTVDILNGQFGYFYVLRW